MTTDRAGERVVLGCILLYLVLALAATAYLAHAPANARGSQILRLPPCAMRHHLGIPCPLCFGTTTFILLWRGYWGAALRLDPLVFAIFWLSGLLVPVLVWEIVSRRPMHRRIGPVSRRAWSALGVTFALLVLMNWLYLIVTLRGVSPDEILRQFP